MTKIELLEKAKPILFNTEMVRAIQDGRKTVTRRVIKSVPETAHMFLGINLVTQKAEFLCGEIRNGFCLDWEVDVKLPFQIGDILYIRETWCKGNFRGEEERYYYRADNKIPHCEWHPSIHMPKEAARIFLRVTGVRVERLQDITEEQTIKEGVRIGLGGEPYFSCRDAYGNLWNCTIKKSDLEKYGWNANPWVWVVEFERVEVSDEQL